MHSELAWWCLGDKPSAARLNRRPAKNMSQKDCCGVGVIGATTSY